MQILLNFKWYWLSCRQGGNLAHAASRRYQPDSADELGLGLKNLKAEKCAGLE